MRFLIVLLSSILIFSGCGKTDGIAPGVDPDAPSFTTPLTFSARASTSFSTSWIGYDAGTASAALEYQVLYSITDNINTVATAQANGTVLTNWTANLLSQNFSSLNMATRYYVSILIRDSNGNMAISTGSTSTLCAGKIIFLANVANGNFGGASGADTTCNNNKPAGFSSSTFKALLTDGTTRRACFIGGNDNCTAVVTGRLDWPMGNSLTYCTSDYETRIGTTSSIGIITVTNANTLTSSATTTYTGFNVSWGSSATSCSNFLSSAGSGIAGSANGTTGSNLFHSNSIIPTCNTAGTVYCVQQ